MCIELALVEADLNTQHLADLEASAEREQKKLDHAADLLRLEFESKERTLQEKRAALQEKQAQAKHQRGTEPILCMCPAHPPLTPFVAPP